MNRLPLLRSLVASLLVTIFALPLTAFAAPPKRVVYTVTVADPAKKLFRVSMTAEGVSDPTVSFAIPAWSPGWYTLTHAEKNISHLSAQNEQKKDLTITTPDKNTFQVATNGAKDITVTYDLLAKDQDPEVANTGVSDDKDYGFTAPYLDESNGFVPGPAALLYVVGGKTVPCRITYKVPEGWKIASANDPVDGDPTTFTAPNYDVLIDQPGELGRFTRVDKTVQGVPFSILLVGAEGKNADPFVDQCWKIAEAGIRVFGQAPFPRYIFHFHFPAKTPAMMGLEHLNSTVVSMPLAALDPPDISAISIIAHEYTHAWNVKRIRSVALGPFDYTKEVRTKDLWWLEGVTDYYAPRLVVEAGLANETYWRSYISDILTGVQDNPARKVVTLETASLKAWEGHSEGYGGLSYYEKGLLVGLLLDVEMRKRTANKVGVDDLFKALFKECETTGKGFPDGEIERLASKLTNSDFAPFFNKTLRSTDELDYEGILAGSGLKLEKVQINTPDLGIDVKSLSFAGGGIRVGTVIPSGPAAKAGLKDKDIITTIEGKDVGDLSGSVLGNKQVGDTLNLGVKRDGQQMNLTVTLGKATSTVYSLLPQKDPSPIESAIFHSITGSK